MGHTPDPVGEFLTSLDAVDGLDARLALAGHGRPFTDVAGHVRANRELVAERLEATRTGLAGGPLRPTTSPAASTATPSPRRARPGS